MFCWDDSAAGADVADMAGICRRALDQRYTWYQLQKNDRCECAGQMRPSACACRWHMDRIRFFPVVSSFSVLATMLAALGAITLEA